jgi:hypothetical protein
MNNEHENEREDEHEPGSLFLVPKNLFCEHKTRKNGRLRRYFACLDKQKACAIPFRTICEEKESEICYELILKQKANEIPF